MKDVLGREVNVGDKVVIAVTGYRTMAVGEIIKLTPKGVQVRFATPWRSLNIETTYRQPDMFCKVQTW